MCADEAGDQALSALLLRRNREELRRELTALEAAAHRIRDALDAVDTCVVCLDRKREVTFLPCNHMACCLECSKPLTACCVCRTAVVSTVVPRAV